MFKKKDKGQRGERNQNFTDQPEDGWLHDDDALAVGEGLFYSFPVLYVGSKIVPHSLRDLSLSDNTKVLRTLIGHVCEETGHRPKKKKKEKVPKHLNKYFTGVSTEARVPVTLCMSAEGMAVAPPAAVDSEAPELNLTGVLFFHQMRGISVATGGSYEDYDCVAYIARDEQDCRQVHVFDCSQEADEVLATLGQSFLLAQEIAMRKRDKPKEIRVSYDQAEGYLHVDPEYDSADPLCMPAPAMYDDADSLSAPVYDDADSNGYAAGQPLYDTAENAPEAAAPLYDSAQTIGGPAAEALYDTATGVAPADNVILEPTYDTASAVSAPTKDIVLEPVYEMADATKLLTTLNKKDSFKRSMRRSKKFGKPVSKLATTVEEPGEEDGVKPSWVFIPPTSGTLSNRITLEQLKQNNPA